MNTGETFSAVSLFYEEDTDAAAGLRQIDELVAPDNYVSEVLPPTGEKLVIEVNKQRVDEVLGRLLSALDANERPYCYERARQPQDPRHMPRTLERGSVDHAMFFFNLCLYMRAGIKSNLAAVRLAQVYDDQPELFDCETASTSDPDMIARVLRENGLGFQDRVAAEWIENSRRLQEKYGGDPRKIFEGVSTYEECQALIQNDRKGGGFKGFQEKMTSMIIYFLMVEDLIEHFNFPVPVDFHVMRVSIANEMITFQNAPSGTNLYTQETTDTLRKLYSEYAREHSVSPLHLVDAVWMLSESSCSRNPGNMTIEPFGRSGRKGRASYLIPGTVDIRNPTQQAAYASSCGVCPIEDTCKRNIPATHHYVGGNVIDRGERVRFPLKEAVVQLALSTTVDLDYSTFSACYEKD